MGLGFAGRGFGLYVLHTNIKQPAADLCDTDHLGMAAVNVNDPGHHDLKLKDIPLTVRGRAQEQESTVTHILGRG